MIMIVVCLILQTAILVGLFAFRDTPPPPQVLPPPHDTSLTQVMNQLSQMMNQTLTYNDRSSQRNADVIKQGFSDMVAGLAKIKLNIPNNASPTTPKKDIRDTYPQIMKYRYKHAETKYNPGNLKETYLKTDLVLLEESGNKFWGTNNGMITWVMDDTGATGEWIVRTTFKAILEGKSNNLVLDVGSNTGLFSMIAAIYGAKRIYAFDPQPLCARYVSESAQINGWTDRIAMINAFVAADDTKKIQVETDTCFGGLKVGVQSKRTTTEINAVSLDKVFLNDEDDIDLMKIDVEGAELFVLDGAVELIKKNRIRNIVVEITPGWWKPNFGIEYAAGARKVKELMIDNGYKVWELPSGKEPAIRIKTWEELNTTMFPVPETFHNQRNFLFSIDDVFP